MLAKFIAIAISVQLYISDHRKLAIIVNIDVSDMGPSLWSEATGNREDKFYKGDP